MTEKSKGAFGQKNYSQMGDGHSKGKDNILKDGSHGKPPDKNWQQHILESKKPSGGKVTPPSASPQKQVQKDGWQQKILAQRNNPQKAKTPNKPATQIKQVSKPKQVTKSR